MRVVAWIVLGFSALGFFVTPWLQGKPRPPRAWGDTLADLVQFVMCFVLAAHVIGWW